MSHSQFHSTNLFILRHAWLNLWDKHMTTGRINQVTISVCAANKSLHSTSTRVRDTFHSGCSLQGFKCLCVNSFAVNNSIPPKRTNMSMTSKWNTLYPVLTSFRPALPVQWTEITAFGEDYQQPAILWKYAQSRRILKLLIAYWCNHRQAIHILPHCRHTSQMDSVWHTRRLIDTYKYPYSLIVSHPVCPDRQACQWIGSENAGHPI